MTERIVVMGTGAIGAAMGAYLIREGHDVTLI
jgi:ketopantoate reductase